MNKFKWGEISTLSYGKGLKDYTNEQRGEENCYRVFGTNGPIGWYKEPLIQEPGIIIGRKGVYRGVHYSPEPFYVIDTAYSLHVDSQKVDLKWAYYKLLTVDINRLNSGSAIPSTKREDFYSIEVNLPPLKTQQKIAVILSAYDDLIDNNRRRIQLLEHAARLLYKEWFVAFHFPGHEHVTIVDGVPEGWEKKKISDVAESISYGYTASATEENIGPKFLRITDIVPDILDWSSVPFCEIPDDKKEKFLLQEGDIVVARTGATTGYAKRVGKRHPEAIFASYLVRIRLSGQLDDCIAGIFLESEGYKNFIKTHLGGAAQPNANAKIISNAVLLVPPKNIQREFREVVEPIFNQKELLQIQNEKLRQARDLLLPRLMNGELAV
jgi:type I restriction enzyme S subunit